MSDYEPMDAEKLTELAGGVRDVTRIVRLFHQGLLEQGFSGVEALTLTVTYLQAFMTNANS